MTRSTHWPALCTCKLTILYIYFSVIPCFHYHNESYNILKKTYLASQNVPLTPSGDTLHPALQSCFWWPCWDGCPSAYRAGALLGQDRGLLPWMEYWGTSSCCGASRILHVCAEGPLLAWWLLWCPKADCALQDIGKVFITELSMH